MNVPPNSNPRLHGVGPFIIHTRERKRLTYVLHTHDQKQTQALPFPWKRAFGLACRRGGRRPRWALTIETRPRVKQGAVSGVSGVHT